MPKINKTLKLRLWVILLFLLVLLTFLIYHFILYGFDWPSISKINVTIKGAYGDSFGPLTSLFTGLAFSGLIVTILLQKNELSLLSKELSDQREEFEKMNKYNQELIKINNMQILYNVYQDRIDRNSKGENKGLGAYIKENRHLRTNRDYILDYFENSIDGIHPTRLTPRQIDH